MAPHTHTMSIARAWSLSSEEALDRLGAGSGDEEAEGVVLWSRVAELADLLCVLPPLQPPAKLPNRRYGLEAHEHQRQEH